MAAPDSEAVLARLDALPGDAFAIGYSGGGDSHALLVLAARRAKSRGRALHALIVDHGLRPESGAEAEQAAKTARRAGATARILRWTGPKPTHGLPAAARAARHRLLAAACRELGVRDLLLGHTLDDQAETVWMRLLAGGGMRALAAMPETGPSPAWPEGSSLRLHRPLLDVRRAELRAWLGAQGENWIEDPSNLDRRQTRVRTRSRLAALEEAGFNPARLARLAADCRALDTAAGEAAARLLVRAARLTPWGGAGIDPAPFAAAPGRDAARALEALVMAVSGESATPKTGALERLQDALAEGRPATGAGARLVQWRSRTWLVRDAGAALGRKDGAGGAAETIISPTAGQVWDGRFEIRTARDGLRAGALGRDYRGLADPACLDTAPGAARSTLCAVRDEGGAVLAIAGVTDHACASFRRLGTERAAQRLFAGGAPAWFYETLQQGSI